MELLLILILNCSWSNTVSVQWLVSIMNGVMWPDVTEKLRRKQTLSISRVEWATNKMQSAILAKYAAVLNVVWNAQYALWLYHQSIFLSDLSNPCLDIYALNDKWKWKSIWCLLFLFCLSLSPIGVGGRNRAEKLDWDFKSFSSPPMIPTYTQTLISFNLLDLRSPHQTKSCFHVSDDGKKSGFDNL